jgi:hypothetical protein
MFVAKRIKLAIRRLFQQPINIAPFFETGFLNQPFLTIVP